jgi:hypothetical protein
MDNQIQQLSAAALAWRAELAQLIAENVAIELSKREAKQTEVLLQIRDARTAAGRGHTFLDQWCKATLGALMPHTPTTDWTDLFLSLTNAALSEHRSQ